MAGNSSNKRNGEESKEGPLISVIIPVYNGAKMIRKALESALKQRMPLEIIVLDDCSKDDLDNVMAGYLHNPVIRYVKNKENMGVATTRNRGVTMAAGKYVAFLDADDWWEEEKLKKQLECIKKSNCVLCTTGRELMTPEGVLTGRTIPVEEEVTYEQLLRHNSINCSSVLLETQVAKEFPMKHEDSHEDYIMWLEILQKYKKACGVNEPLMKYRLSSKGKSGSKWNSAKMTFKVYRYMGFGVLKSCWCFLNYAVNGIIKYFPAK